MFKILILALLTLNSFANTHVIMKTNVGEVEIMLFDEKAPKTVENFLTYVKSGFYKNTIFHRVIENFMIQGGGFDSNLRQKKTNAPIVNEATNNIPNDKGTLAMARTGVVNSATSQFFINVKNNSFLNHRGMDPQSFGYAVFAKVVKGMDVVEKIKSVRTTTKGPYQNVPVETISITDMYIKK